MSVIKNIKLGTNVYGVIYGKGVITNVFEDSFYKFEVTYDNGDIIYYTDEGIPGWGLKHHTQTVFNVSDIDLMEYDLSPSTGILTIKKIIKYVVNKTLEIKCPSGIWCNISDAPEALMEQYIVNNKLHLFRKNKKSISNG